MNAILKKINQSQKVVEFCKLTQFEVTNIRDNIYVAQISYKWTTGKYVVYIYGRGGEGMKILFDNFKPAYNFMNCELEQFLN